MLSFFIIKKNRDVAHQSRLQNGLMCTGILLLLLCSCH